MLFNSFIFLFFLALVVPAYYFMPSKYRNVFLVICSYFFYGYWDWRFTSLLLFSTVVDFFVGKAIFVSTVEKKRKQLVILSLITNLGILGFFKYFNFFVGSFDAMAVSMGLKLDFLHLNILLPVGISFYTFQTLSYTLDIYRKRLEPTNSFIDFSLFVSFFPQLVAGPIERAVHLLPQIAKRPTPTKQQFKEGIALISVGMFKKVLIGDTCGRIVDNIFTEPTYWSSIELLMGLVLFAIQIYNDFSGYSHIARGTAKLLGFELMENFNQPYLSSSITEFWRRWHISLSSWLRDYLYISLGGNRKGNRRTYINLMLTMLLGGLWHGASWTFVVWGGLHGLYLAVHKLMLKDKKPTVRFRYVNKSQTVKFLGKVIATNVLVLLTWLFFRADSFDTAFYFLQQFVNWSPDPFTLRAIGIMAAYSILSMLIDIMEYYTEDHTFMLRYVPAVRYTVFAVTWIYSLMYLFQAPPMPFIYFQF
jgi:alginate O-acetyltransferase complex protein AlgI